MSLRDIEQNKKEEEEGEEEEKREEAKRGFYHFIYIFQRHALFFSNLSLYLYFYFCLMLLSRDL